jgi:hypothetical protein
MWEDGVTRAYSATDPFARALLAGFIAATATLFMFGLVWGAAVLIAAHPVSDPGWAALAYTWLQVLPKTALVDPARPLLYQAVGLYFVAGVLWAPVYTQIFSVRLTGLQWERGLVFACVPWLFSSVVLLPVAGGGLLGLGLGAGPLPLVGSLVLYAVYGVALSRLTGSNRQVVLEVPTRGDAQSAASQSTEVGAAAGVVAGLVVGAALGMALISTSHFAGVTGGAGMHPLGLLSASTLVGGALGGLIGSFFGLARAAAYP